jgi:hypothetical protein
VTLISQELREAVARRAGGVCEYCCLPQESQVATFPIDHVVPVSSGGLTVLDNLAFACPTCNSAKSTHVVAQDSEMGAEVPLFNPRSQIWSEHFRCSADDPAVLEALTATGRATMELLGLNSQRRCAIRQWLMVVGKHPPQ